MLPKTCRNCGSRQCSNSYTCIPEHSISQRWLIQTRWRTGNQHLADDRHSNNQLRRAVEGNSFQNFKSFVVRHYREFSGIDLETSGSHIPAEAAAVTSLDTSKGRQPTEQRQICLPGRAHFIKAGGGDCQLADRSDHSWTGVSPESMGSLGDWEAGYT